jgi:hypothetical protein
MQVHQQEHAAFWSSGIREILGPNLQAGEQKEKRAFVGQMIFQNRISPTPACFKDVLGGLFILYSESAI